MVSKAALAIPIAVCAAGVSLYTYLTYQRRNKKRDDDDDDEVPVKDWTEHRMVLNKAYAQLVLGQLEFIKQTSNTIINVLKIPDEDQTFSIVMKGTPASVQEAEFMVNRLIESSPEITTSIMEVPKEKIKLIVGDFGSSLLKISQETGSRLLLKCDPDFYEVSPFYIEIQGPREKNAIAYELIRQTLGKDPAATQTPTPNKWDNFPKESPLEVINSSQDSKYVEVTVSSITTVNKFYVQLCRYSATLVKMEGRLADYFSIRVGPLGKVKKPKLGALIAVPNAKQGEWHRAQIIGINDKNAEAVIVKAKFVDYGDEEEVKLDDVRSLPSEFSQYPFFAVECSLAGVVSNTVSPDGEEVWSEEALDFFESLVSDKPNKILMVRKFGEYDVFSKKSRPGNGRKLRYKIPALDVVDTNSSEDIDIAIELISKGFARSNVGSEKKAQPSNSQPQKRIIAPEVENDEDEDTYGFDMP
ncbi:tudor and KH domain-containing protein homolog isoform X2 [Ischnura elegans]|uniref:tudor and KH domain-containing protein homolog isoform X2 n=1 Tax=Ischnura elegans TaxID=197161 RepID=UPI001ED8A2BE|nr:tudor and KH domain-containing protein homolog isoform X2 [Ischnura elegans]